MKLTNYIDMDTMLQLPINKCVSLYFMSSYLYYERNISIMADETFDLMCSRIAKEYGDITHMHKEKLDKESLAAGTGFDIEYTNLMIAAALDFNKRNK